MGENPDVKDFGLGVSKDKRDQLLEAINSMTDSVTRVVKAFSGPPLDGKHAKSKEIVRLVDIVTHDATRLEGEAAQLNRKLGLE